jgi:hypothetical protein
MSKSKNIMMHFKIFWTFSFASRNIKSALHKNDMVDYEINFKFQTTIAQLILCTNKIEFWQHRHGEKYN